MSKAYQCDGKGGLCAKLVIGKPKRELYVYQTKNTELVIGNYPGLPLVATLSISEGFDICNECLHDVVSFIEEQLGKK